MPVTFESVRFGTVEVSDEEVIVFPAGLIGLGGSRYALIDRNPGTGFRWLHAVDDPALALPVVEPEQFFSDFSLQISDSDGALIGLDDLAAADIYVTVRAAADPREITANLRAPLVVHAGRGHQVINLDEQASLQAPLFVISTDVADAPADAAPTVEASAAVDAA